ncbi:MAG: PIN domain-containing protein [Gemmatimonadetes bacterium]|nr:PIN domain-containing protein [Gemmatimonadota bacterium]
MRVAYIDSSCMVAIRFSESGSEALADRLENLELFSANLLEAEFRAALTREGAEDKFGLLARVQWVLPDRPLSPEIGRILRLGHVRGSDLWHLATALYLAEATPDLPFLTLDLRQREIAAQLGFHTA